MNKTFGLEQGLSQVFTLRDQLKVFISENNVLGTMAGTGAAFATGNMIKSFVSEIIFPLMYTIFGYKGSLGDGEFSPISTKHASKFGKEFLTFLLVISVTFFFIKYVVAVLFGLRTTTDTLAVSTVGIAPSTAPSTSTAPSSTAPSSTAPSTSTSTGTGVNSATAKNITLNTNLLNNKLEGFYEGFSF
jgi:large-conductance mechanosensitive channel